MSKVKMDMNNNPCRYLTVAVDGYENRCMTGMLYQEGSLSGIQYNSFLDVVLNMERLFDELSCPKQTMEFRSFSNTKNHKASVQKLGEMRAGKLATFRIYVRYRYNTSWQGDVVRMDVEKSESFESFLEMVRIIDHMLMNSCERLQEGKGLSMCRIALDTYDEVEMTGSVQRVNVNSTEKFSGIAELAETMENLVELGIREEDKEDGIGEVKIISEESLLAYRTGGYKATFLIKILFREHATWQGVIYWREMDVKQGFRSFLEMLMLIISTTEKECREEQVENQLMQG